MPEFRCVECSQGPAPMYRRSRHNQVVGANHQSRVGELHPETRMHSRQGGVQWHDFQTAERLFQPTAAPPALDSVGFGLNSKPQLRQGDGADRNRFRRPGTQPRRQIETIPFVSDQQRTVEDQPHGFLRGLRVLRPLRTAAARARRSCVLSPASSRSAANS